MKNKIITIIFLIVVIFILGVVSLIKTKPVGSPFDGLIPESASILLILDPETSVHKVSEELVRAVTALPDLETLGAEIFLADTPNWRAFAYRPDTGWIVFEEIRSSYPEGFVEQKTGGVWVYGKQGGIDLVESVRLGKEASFAIKGSALKIDASIFAGALGSSDKARTAPDGISAAFKINGASLKVIFQTPIEKFLQNADIPFFIPPKNTIVLPLTSPIPKQDSSLLGILIDQIEIQPGGFLAFNNENRLALGWPKNFEAGDDFLKEQAKKLSHTLAVRFPQTKERLLPDGTIAELLVINEEQFKPSFSDDGLFATLQVGDEITALAEAKDWILVGNDKELVFDLKNAFLKDAADESCKRKNGRVRAVFHFSSGLIGMADANGKGGILCLSE